MDDDLIRQAIHYHEATKHHYRRYARGPGYMDWSTQPDPFRRFSGSPLVFLPPIMEDESPPYRRIFDPGAVPSTPLTDHAVSRFLELSLAVSAWKQAGDSRWALRSNPSSGNLHPTEGYLAFPAMDGVHSAPGIYHYCPREHALERRTGFSPDVWSGLMAGFPQDAFLAGLTSIHWREAWKYGERAFRYCQHDAGHALAAWRIAAAALGWDMILLDEMDDPAIARLFGVDREADFGDAEREHPDLVCAVLPKPAQVSVPRGLDQNAVARIAGGKWLGQANRLSAGERPWKIIDDVARATWKSGGTLTGGKTFGPAERVASPPDSGRLSPRRERVTVRQIVRQRRSAVAFDGVTHIDARDFFRMLSHTRVAKRSPAVPWDVAPGSPRVHLCLYVHRVTGLAPGLYFLVRDPDALTLLKAAMKPGFLWRKPEGCPADLDLYLLEAGNFQELAAQVSCGQDIAGQGAFSLGMIAEFASSLEECGAWFYRRLFWESGMVGQTLYLAAEEAGVRGTGIGCYFDDPVHQILGLSGNAFQSLYHFTIGGPVDDARLTTHPAYVWSCEISSGRFVSRMGTATSTGERVAALPAAATARWGGNVLARVGAGLRGLSRYRREQTESFSALTRSPINVVETSPDETGGEDELMAGDVLNRLVDGGKGDAEGLFFIVRAGLVQGGMGAVADEMARRGRPFDDMISLGDGRRFCLHPEFLRDQLARSRHRLGLGGIDLVLLRVPDEARDFTVAEEIYRGLRNAAAFLQGECERGKLQGFGVSAQGLACARENPRFLSLERLAEELRGFPGFGAVEVRANFLEAGALSPEDGTSLLDRARKMGLLTIVGSPLRANYNGGRLNLVDHPEQASGKAQDAVPDILEEMRRVETEIHGSLLTDGRSLQDVLRQAGISSPFRLRALVEPFLREKVDSPRRRSMEESFQNVLFLEKSLGDQLVRAGFWDAESSVAALGSCEALLDRFLEIDAAGAEDDRPEELARLRRRYFPDAPADLPLQCLGIRWLLDRGADLVLTNARKTSYVEEAVKILESFSA